MTKRQALTHLLLPAALFGFALSLAADFSDPRPIVLKTGAPTALKDTATVESLLAPDAGPGTGPDRGEEPAIRPPADGTDSAEDMPPVMPPGGAPTERVEFVLRRGDTLVDTMTASGVASAEAHAATRALRTVLDPRRLQAGQSVTLVFQQGVEGRRFLGVRIVRRDGGVAVAARIGDTGYEAFEADDPSALDLAGFQPWPAAADAAPPAVDLAPDTAIEAAAVGALSGAPDAAAIDPDPINPKFERIDVTLGRGDTLFGAMTDAGISPTVAHYAIRSLQSVENPRRLQPGQAIALVFERHGNERSFQGLQVTRRDGRYAIVAKDGERGFKTMPVGDPASLDLAGFGPPPVTGSTAAPVLIEQPLPSLAMVPPVAGDIDRDVASRHMVLDAGEEDSAQEERYLDFLSLRIDRVELTVGRGDTLAGMLSDADVDRLQAHAAVTSLRGVFDPRRLRAGQQVTLVFESRGERRDFMGFEIEPNIESRVAVSRTETGDFVAESIANRFVTRLMAATGAIESSLYAASNAAGVPDPVLIALIRAYSFEVDFQRDIRPGDGFEILYEQDFAEDGSFARNGNVLFSNLRLRGREFPMYRFGGDDGSVDYYDRDGQSVRRALMRTPIDGARISSRYGMRRHPVLGYSRMHQGTDFAAPRGTPVYAAGTGTIERRGRNGGYGNYIRIRHNGSYKTAYAHLSRFARGIVRGGRVQQGQVIAYVGSTGRSTGPHLHYEVFRDGRQVNPMTLDLPSGRQLEGDELARFQRLVAERDRQYAIAMADVQVATSPQD